MGHQLNIKNPETTALATELAQLTGESVTAAVTQALRERLERERRARTKPARMEAMLAMGREIRAHMQEPVSSDTNWLYGEDGLPA